jgi:hypothetical protein
VETTYRVTGSQASSDATNKIARMPAETNLAFRESSVDIRKVISYVFS